VTRIPAGKVALHVREQGSAAPVLLVHGFPLKHTMWDAQFEALASKYRLIAPDLRGFGASQVTKGTVSMEELADDLAALLDTLNVSEPITFCGLSMGGYVGWEFFRKYRDRVRSLVMCDTRAACDTADAADARRQLATDVLATGPSLLVESLLPRLVSPVTLEKRPQIVEALRSIILSAPPEGIAAALNGMANRRDARDLLDKIDVPTLLVVGRDDALSPVDEMREMADSIATSTLVVVDDAGHLSPMERADVVNAALADFLPLV